MLSLGSNRSWFSQGAWPRLCIPVMRNINQRLQRGRGLQKELTKAKKFFQNCLFLWCWGLNLWPQHMPGKHSTTELHPGLSLKCLRNGWKAAYWSFLTNKESQAVSMLIHSHFIQFPITVSHGCLFSWNPQTRLHIYFLQAQLRWSFYLLSY